MGMGMNGGGWTFISASGQTYGLGRAGRTPAQSIMGMGDSWIFTHASRHRYVKGKIGSTPAPAGMVKPEVSRVKDERG